MEIKISVKDCLYQLALKYMGNNPEIDFNKLSETERLKAATNQQETWEKYLKTNKIKLTDARRIAYIRKILQLKTTIEKGD